MTDTATSRDVAGTSTAGRTRRTAQVTPLTGAAIGDVDLSIWSASESFLANIRLSPAQARELATNLQNAATKAGLQARKAGAK